MARDGMVSVRFTPEEATRVRAAAEKEGVTLSEYLRRALVWFLTPRPRRIEPGMARADRERFRAEILEREMARARQRAAESHRSMTCSGYHGVPVDHARCKGEEPGNDGCLCECHDR